jgi:transketolase
MPRFKNWKDRTRMRDRFVETLCALADEDPRITLITGDLGFGVLDPFRSKFGSRFINAGVAEQNMTLLAVGMALEGRVVFTYSIANFPTLRCLEMIRNDAAYHDAAVKVVAIGGGFSYGSLGISHHATEDLSIMRALPGVDVIAPGSRWETAEATRAIAARPGTSYLRIDKDPGVDGLLDVPFEIGVPRMIAAGSEIAFLVTGGITSEVVKAADLLRTQQGVTPAIYSVHSVRPISAAAVCAIARRYRVVVTVEEHTIAGGLSAAVLEVLADHGTFPERFIRIGLQACFSSTVGTQQHLRAVYGLDARSIAQRVASAVFVGRA